MANPPLAKPLLEHPTVAEIDAGLGSWALRRPDRLQVETPGRSTEGRPILLARITEHDTPDDDKRVVLLTATHAGCELNACTGLLHLTRWLLSDDEAAYRIRKSITTLVMPCVNPDGYDRSRTGDFIPRNHTATDLDAYEFTWDGPPHPERNPEGMSVYTGAERYHPDAAWDVHGLMYAGESFWESTGFSWGCFEAHSFNTDFGEAIDRAAEDAGFLIIRPQEDCGRVKDMPPDQDLRHHFYGVRRDRKIMSFLYHRYHTLAINGEAGFDQSVVVRGRRFLELGCEVGRREFYPGYPVNQIGGWGNMAVTAWGRTAEERRRSRVELWDTRHINCVMESQTHSLLTASSWQRAPQRSPAVVGWATAPWIAPCRHWRRIRTSTPRT